eukprot:6201230-Pleurochrysis_carterae.AAC.1
MNTQCAFNSGARASVPPSAVCACAYSRQTALFSATQTKNVADLARLAIQQKPVYVSAQQSEVSSATVSTLEQGFVVCESARRFLLLFTFLKKNLKKK